MKNTIIIKALTLCTIGCNSSTPKCNDTNSQDYKDGYMAEINFIDGQALTPDNFGQWDSTGSTWIPKAYAGAYGANGFYLNFSNPSAIGTDTGTIDGTHTAANNFAAVGFSNANDILLLHCDGSNGSSVFTDSATSKAVTVSSAVISNSTSVFGGTSGYFNGSSYLSLPSSTDFDFGSGDWTIEFWLRSSPGGATYAFNFNNQKICASLNLLALSLAAG